MGTPDSGRCRRAIDRTLTVLERCEALNLFRLVSRYVILCSMKNEPTQDSTNDWIAAAQARGYAPALQTLLDVLEPVSPLAAQMIWVLQPMGRVFGMQQVLGSLAQALESPDELDELRRQLGKHDSEA